MWLLLHSLHRPLDEIKTQDGACRQVEEGSLAEFRRVGEKEKSLQRQDRMEIVHPICCTQKIAVYETKTVSYD